MSSREREGERGREGREKAERRQAEKGAAYVCMHMYLCVRTHK